MRRKRMGGAKKRSLAQAEKQQQLQTKKEKGGAKERGGSKPKQTEKPAAQAGLPDFNSREFITELGNMKAVTPSSLASRFNVKLSVAKDVLDDLARRGVLTLVAGSNRLKIYTVASP